MRRIKSLHLVSGRPDNLPDEVIVKRINGWHDETARKAGRVRDVVRRQIERGEDPRREDIAAALREGNPNQQLVEYVASRYVLGRLRRPGRKTSRTWAEEKQIALAYYAAKDEAQRAYAADSRRPRDVATQAKRIVGKKYGIKKRALEIILEGIRAEYFDD